jgi:hypothetical protein
MIGRFTLRKGGQEYVVELHWVEGGPAWVVDSSEALEDYLNTLHGYRSTHPDSPGYPYWWEAIHALGRKNITITETPPRVSRPPKGAVF